MLKNGYLKIYFLEIKFQLYFKIMYLFSLNETKKKMRHFYFIIIFLSINIYEIKLKYSIIILI